MDLNKNETLPSLSLLELGGTTEIISEGENLLSHVARIWFSRRFRESGRNYEYANKSTKKVIGTLSFLLYHPNSSYTKKGKAYLAKIGVSLGHDGRINQHPKTIWHLFLIVLDKLRLWSETIIKNKMCIGPRHDSDSDSDADADTDVNTDTDADVETDVDSDLSVDDEDDDNTVIDGNLFYSKKLVAIAEKKLIDKCLHFLRIVTSLHHMLVQKNFDFEGRFETNVVTFDSVEQLLEIMLHYEQILLSWMTIKQHLYIHVFTGSMSETDIATVGAILIERRPELKPFFTSKAVTNVLFLNFLDRYACSKIYVDADESKHFKVWQLEDTSLYLGRFREPTTMWAEQERKDIVGEENYKPYDMQKDYLLSHFHYSMEFSQRLCWRRPFTIERERYFKVPGKVIQDDGTDTRNIRDFFSLSYINGTFIDSEQRPQLDSKKNWLNPLRNLYLLGGKRGTITEFFQMRTCLPITEIKNNVLGQNQNEDILGNDEEMIYYAPSHINVLDDCSWTMKDYNEKMKQADAAKEERTAAIKRKQYGDNRLIKRNLRCTEDLQLYASTYEMLQSTEYPFREYLNHLIYVDNQQAKYRDITVKRQEISAFLFDDGRARALEMEVIKADPLRFQNDGENLYGNFPSPFPANVNPDNQPNKTPSTLSDKVYHAQFTKFYTVALNHLSYRCEIECLTQQNRPTDQEAILSECCDDRTQWLNIEDPGEHVNAMWFRASVRGFLALKGLRQLMEILKDWQLDYHENARYDEDQESEAKLQLDSITKAVSDFIYTFSYPKKKTTRPIPLFKIEMLKDENILDAEYIDRKRAKTDRTSSTTTSTTTTTTTSRPLSTTSSSSGVTSPTDARQAQLSKRKQFR